jgi:hypothetical protein
MNQREEDELRFARDDLFEKLNTLNAGIKSLVTLGVMGLIVLIFIAVSIAISARRRAVPVKSKRYAFSLEASATISGDQSVPQVDS